MPPHQQSKSGSKNKSIWGTSIAPSPRPIRQSGYKKYNIDSPPKGTIDIKIAIKNIKDDGFGRYLPKRKKKAEASVEARSLIFLYGRGFMPGKSKREERIKQIKIMLSKTNIKGSTSTPLEILTAVIAAEGDTELTDGDSADMYQYYQRLLELLQEKGYYGIHYKIKLYLRTQSYGSCYLIAPCIFICLVARFYGYDDMAPIDVHKYVRRSYTDEQLINLITKDAGGDPEVIARHLLRQMTGRNVSFTAHNIHDRFQSREMDSVFKDIRNYGPALITSFKCPKNFGNASPVKFRTSIGIKQYHKYQKKKLGMGTFIEFETTKTSIENNVSASCDQTARELFSDVKESVALGSDQNTACDRSLSTNDHLDWQDTEGRQPLSKAKKEEDSYHSMIILDARKDNKGHYFFLVQNWWSDSQLVEMSDEYLAACDAQIHLLSNSRKDIVFDKNSDVYSKNKALIAHCNNIDRAENYYSGITYEYFHGCNCSAIERN